MPKDPGSTIRLQLLPAGVQTQAVYPEEEVVTQGVYPYQQRTIVESRTIYEPYFEYADYQGERHHGHGWRDDHRNEHGDWHRD